ncbi:hypothetical protein [Niveibacterium sp.]|uniref:hypothetical protein n=1 Tax=Niveibacterium sp. TaxID=2017444 RepID=UPI0035AE95CE
MFDDKSILVTGGFRLGQKRAGSGSLGQLVLRGIAVLLGGELKRGRRTACSCLDLIKLDSLIGNYGVYIWSLVTNGFARSQRKQTFQGMKLTRLSEHRLCTSTMFVPSTQNVPNATIFRACSDLVARPFRFMIESF